MATISDVARLLDVGRDTVKHWTTEFAEHLSLTARVKGKVRQFSEADLRVLALISYYWEEDPDLENIHAMLNSGDYDEDVFAEFASLNTPVFQEVPDEIDETWQHGVLVGGWASRNWPQVARAYKKAADELLTQALRQCEPHEFDYPIIFLYRHTIEVYLKAMLTPPPKTHDLGRLTELLELQCGNKIAPCVKDRLRDFQRMDEHSDVFRFAEPPPDGELWVDFHQLKLVMDRLVEAFEHQMSRQGIRE
jgi:DNA-binding transcriptional MerR regulator